jgi:hypothetical protein
MKFIFFCKMVGMIFTETVDDFWELRKNVGKKMVKMEALNSVNINIKNDIFGKKNSRKGNYPNNKWVQISRRF